METPYNLQRMSETQYQKLIWDTANKNGWTCYFTQDSTGSPAGFPDLTCVRASSLLFLEVKTATGLPTSAQRMWRQKLEAVPGVIVRLVRPTDWPSLKEQLQFEGYE